MMNSGRINGRFDVLLKPQVPGDDLLLGDFISNVLSFEDVKCVPVQLQL